MTTFEYLRRWRSAATRRLSVISAVAVILSALAAVPADALITSKTPAGSNHANAHLAPHASTGDLIPVGIIEIDGGVDTTKTSIDDDNRLIKNLNFIGVATPVVAEPADVAGLVTDHATRVADIVASSHAAFTGVAPDSLLYVGAVEADAEIFGAVVWIGDNYDVGTFNLSLGGPAQSLVSTRNHTEVSVTLTSNGDSTNISTNPFSFGAGTFQSVDSLSYRIILDDVDNGPGEVDNGNLQLNIGGVIIGPFNSTIATDGQRIQFTNTQELTPAESQSLVTALGGAGNVHIKLEKVVDGVANDVTPTNDAAGFNLAAQLTLRQFNDNGADQLPKALDWHSRTNDSLMVVAAGNAGRISGQIESPGDIWNGISVGAVNQAFTKRADFSSYRQSVGNGKPDVVAPGENIVTEGLAGADGTSFAAPHVTGISALLEAGTENTAGLALGQGGNNHLATKAIILNSARKRFAVKPENLVNTDIRDNDATNAEPADGDYLDAGLLRVGFANNAPNDPGNAPRTASWTPSSWSYNGDVFTTINPLDDELGTGLVDAERALIQLDGGQQGPGNVGQIGWDVNAITPADGFIEYTLDVAVNRGDFVTVTLDWDRFVTRVDDGNGLVDFNDTFTSNIPTTPNLDLILTFQGDVFAVSSDSAFNNVEHLHLPFMENGLPGDYAIRVFSNGLAGLASVDYGLAWWTVPEPATVILVVWSLVACACNWSRKRSG